MNTKKSFLLLAFLALIGMFNVNAQVNQKIAYVDTDYILQNIPEYSDAQEEINQMSLKWEKELKREYQTESILLSEDQKKKKETAIDEKEQELAQLQMQYYGPQGELFTKRVELIQPIQEKIYNAINQVAMTKNYAFVLDKASGTTILYCNEKNDISDDVLDEIGNVMQTVRRQDRKRGSATSNSGAKSDNKK